jgi:hypothetical protein
MPVLLAGFALTLTDLPTSRENGLNLRQFPIKL